MPENFDHSEPEHRPSEASDDLPEDFMDELAHTEIDPDLERVADAVASSDVEHGFGSGEHPTPTHFEEPAPAMYPTPTGTAGHPAPPEPRPSVAESRPRPEKPRGEIGASEGRSVLIASLLFLGIGLGIWSYLKYGANAFAPEAKAPANPAPAAAPAATPTASSSADEVKSLKSEVDAIAKQVAGLQERIEAMPKPESGPDVSGLQAKVEDLAKVPEMVAPLPGKLQTLDERLGASDKSLEALKGELAAVREQVKKIAETPAPAPAPGAAPRREDVDVAGQAMSEGDQLFKKGQFAEALAVFTKLESTNPDDARVWYYAALANGRSTNQWVGETVRLVQEGVKREKEGKPESAKIDAVFSDLKPENGRAWLDHFRKQAKP